MLLLLLIIYEGFASLNSFTFFSLLEGQIDNAKVEEFEKKVKQLEDKVCAQFLYISTFSTPTGFINLLLTS